MKRVKTYISLLIAINREEIKLAKGLENFGDFIMDEMTKIIKSKPLST